ncbi:fasciclin domain-containing protein [Erythrobacter sp. YJ-T3-07]|mgnify:CR=1 FL=1|uniref:fasciclin domain-containing protein n=1 Tax=Erythrobacter sp. YJ-T3-07 TaxID=2793063 RepID=UPI0018D27D6E|nr:fasciclin domain-containing protein [Erythrobacter sp. YJ-T3-07]MBH1945278.1 fasciclin domain-containing protein [Erythrobacter sp. YJ-T3-07]
MNKLALTLASVAALSLGACAESDTANDDTAVTDDTAADQMAVDDTASGTIVEVAQADPQLSTLVEAVTAAGLGETLSSGEYTVFAPTNAAFDKVPQATRDELMSEAGKEDLTNILTYHVVEGMTDAAALTAAIEAAGEDGYKLTTVNGAELTAMMDGSNVVLRDAAGNTATVTMTDIDASNGVVHVIDTVLMPQ